jgi:hypothetical protein
MIYVIKLIGYLTTPSIIIALGALAAKIFKGNIEFDNSMEETCIVIEGPMNNFK